MNAKEVLRVGVAQIASAHADVSGNKKIHLDFIERARKQKVELLVFPELSLSGYPGHAADVQASAIAIDHEIVEGLAEAAGPMAVIFGAIEETPAAQFYDTSFLLEDGQVAYLHRKLNLATYGRLEEGKYFATGRYVEKYDLKPLWRLATLICADAWNPALVHLAALHGATLLTIPIASAHEAVSTEFSNPDGWSLLARFYAMIYGMPIVVANRVGQERDLKFWGRSQIVNAFGEVVEQALDDEACLLTATLDYAQTRKARLQLPTVRDSNLALVGREIARLETLLGVPDTVRKFK